MARVSATEDVDNVAIRNGWCRSMTPSPRGRDLIRVRVHGSAGPEVVVLHGGPGAAGDAAPLARTLAEGFRVLEPWQRGRGRCQVCGPCGPCGTRDRFRNVSNPGNPQLLESFGYSELTTSRRGHVSRRDRPRYIAARSRRLVGSDPPAASRLDPSARSLEPAEGDTQEVLFAYQIRNHAARKARGSTTTRI